MPKGKTSGTPHEWQEGAYRETQADRLFEMFGNARRLKEALDRIGYKRNYSSVYRWAYSRAEGGTGGLIPPNVWPFIHKAARLEGISLGDMAYDPYVTFREVRLLKTILDEKGEEKKFQPKKVIDQQARALKAKGLAREEMRKRREEAKKKEENVELEDLLS